MIAKLNNLEIFEIRFFLLLRIFNVLRLQGIFTAVYVDISIVNQSIVSHFIVFYFHHFVFGIVNVVLKMALALQVVDCAFFQVHVYCILICLCVVVGNLILFACYFVASNVQVPFIRVLGLYFLDSL